MNGMREAVAREYGFVLFRQYGEEQAAHLLNVDLSTLKRWRAEGPIRYVSMGPRKIRYLGIHIADMLLKGVGSGEVPEAWIPNRCVLAVSSSQVRSLVADLGR